MKFKGKVVLVTGGTSGIGKSCAIAFAKQGASIVLTGRNKHAMESTLAEMKSNGYVVEGVIADAGIEADNERMVKTTIDVYGRLDVLINNAGISMRALFADVQLDVIRKVMDINFWGTVYATKYALPHITKTKGSIIGISSIAGYRGLPGRTGYSASKFAMQGFLEALRTELLKTGVHVLVACPGFTASNIRNTALAADGSGQGESPRDEQKMMSSDEVAKHIVKAASGRKRDIILTSQGRMTVFLNKWFPKFMDKMVYNHMAKEADSPFK